MRQFFSDFRHLPRNAVVATLVLPLFFIPHNLVSSYASLYMIENGLSATDVGMINSVAFVVKAILAVLAAAIVNKLGRRVAGGLLDIFAWGLPMLILSFATQYWQFMLAWSLNSISVITTIVVQCLCSDDVAPEDRLKAFSYYNLMGLVMGIFVPLSGVIIASLGFLRAMRTMYFFAFIGMTLFGISKLVFLRETAVGMQLKKQKCDLSTILGQFSVPLAGIRTSARMRLLLGFYIALHFATNLNNIYYFPFLKASLGFQEDFLPYFAFLTNILSAIAYFLIIPRLRGVVGKSAVGGLVMYAAGSALLVLANLLVVGNSHLRYLALGSTALWAVAGSVINPVISVLVMLPASSIGGMLFDLSPVLPMVVVGCLYLTALALFLLIRRREAAEKNDRPDPWAKSGCKNAPKVVK